MKIKLDSYLSGKEYQGIETWINPKNKFCVVKLHYTADPRKRLKSWKAGASEGMTEDAWNQEYEISSEAFKGQRVYKEFDALIHKKALEPDKDLIFYRGWDFGYHRPACYDKDTQILTKSGWKYFYELKDNEEVLTLNPITNVLEYQKIQARITYDYTGAMYHWESIHNIGCDLRVTENHFMVGYNRHFKRLEFRIAEQLKSNKIRFTIPTSGIWNGEVFNPIINLDMKTFCEFMGLWLSEGSLNPGYSPKGKEYGIKHYNIWVWQKERNEEMEQLLNKLPIKFNWYREGWCGASKELFLYLQQFGHSGDKYIPQEIKNSNTECIKSFLKFYELGDGTWVQGRCVLITTKSKKMADDLQELYMKTGVSTRVKKVKKRNYYEVRKNNFYNIGLKQKFLKIENVINEPVYCVTVPNHTVYVRRREGRAVFSGNCIVTQINVTDQWLLIKEFLGKDIALEIFAKEVMSKCPAGKYKDFCDPAGAQSSDKSVRTSIEILNAFNIYPKYKKSKPSERIRIIRSKLLIRSDKQCGTLIDNSCKMLLEGFSGGYHYPEDPTPGTEDEPEKDGFYDHIFDALGYIAYSLFKYRDPDKDNKKKIIYKAREYDKWTGMAV